MAKTRTKKKSASKKTIKAKAKSKPSQLERTASKSKSASHSQTYLDAVQNIWPMERDVLFRPDRFKYVRKLLKPQGCVFCEAAKKTPSFETLCLYQSAHSMIVLNKFPYNSGHLLVIPRRHTGDPLELTEEQFTDLHLTLKLALKALHQAYEPGGINVGLNLGAVAGAGIPEHLHYHVIPRWAGDLNFFPLVAETKTVIESLEMSFDRLLAYLKAENKL